MNLRSSLLALALTLATSSASAALIPHTDLASTAYEATDIVRATWRSERTDQGVRLGTYRVEHVFAGTLFVGSTLEVSDGNIASGEQSPVPAARYLALAPAVAGEPRRLATNGMRAVYDGHVFRFEQLNNPGLEVPLPQGDSLTDGRGDAERVQTGVTPERFEALLADAITRARELRELRAHWSANAPSRMDALLLPAPARDTRGGYRDDFTLAVINTLFEHQRVDEALSLVARNSLDPTLAWDLERSAPAADLIPRARAHALRPVRLAAVRLLRAACVTSDPAADALVALLGDPDALVREAAATNLAPVFSSLVGGDGAAAFSARKARVERALLARFRGETDAAVRLAIAATINASRNSLRTLPMPAGAPPLVLRAVVSGDGVQVDAVCARPDARGGDAGVELITPSGALQHGHTGFSYACGGERTASNTGLVDGLTVGRYGIRLRLGRRAWPLGTLVVSPDGSRRIE
ncbi:MAG: hypothetical protein U0326_05640 [Polyangiales bacterium]